MAENAILDERKQELADIDARIALLKENLSMANDLESLHEDPRFQKVILGGYFDKEAERIFGLLVDPTHHLKRDVMETLMDKLTAIRSVKQYFGMIMTNGAMASEQIEEEEEFRKQFNAQESIIDVEVE